MLCSMYMAEDKTSCKTNGKESNFRTITLMRQLVKSTSPKL